MKQVAKILRSVVLHGGCVRPPTRNGPYRLCRSYRAGPRPQPVACPASVCALRSALSCDMWSVCVCLCVRCGCGCRQWANGSVCAHKFSLVSVCDCVKSEKSTPPAHRTVDVLTYVWRGVDCIRVSSTLYRARRIADRRVTTVCVSWTDRDFGRRDEIRIDTAVRFTVKP